MDNAISLWNILNYPTFSCYIQTFTKRKEHQSRLALAPSRKSLSTEVLLWEHGVVCFLKGFTSSSILSNSLEKATELPRRSTTLKMTQLLGKTYNNILYLITLITLIVMSRFLLALRVSRSIINFTNKLMAPQWAHQFPQLLQTWWCKSWRKIVLSIGWDCTFFFPYVDDILTVVRTNW